MSNQHKHAEPKTTQRTKLNDWMTATSDALFALLGGVVVFALFTMLLRFIKEAASFQCPSGPLYKACGFVKDKGIFTLKRFAEQALNTTDLAKVKGGLEVVVLLAILISATRWTSETVVVDGPKEKTKSG